MWFFKVKKNKEIFLLVHMYKINVHTNVEKDGILYIYLYESNFGNRKMEHKSSIKHNDNLNAIDVYCDTIYPWLNGKFVKEIPSYWDVSKENKKFKVKSIYDIYFKE